MLFTVAILFLWSCVNTYFIYRVQEGLIDMIRNQNKLSLEENIIVNEKIESLKSKIYTLEQRIKSLPTK